MAKAMWTCGACRQEFDEREIVPHMIAVHPGLADELEQWSDGGIVTAFLEDVELTIPEAW